MSAIYGIFHSDKKSVSPEHIDQLAGAYNSIPVDNVQIWRSNNAFLGCHQQWITPESVGEQNPLYDSKQELTVTADAIIDNREDLASLLGIGSKALKTMTDTEIILLAYKKWGDSCPSYLVGDFSFFIFDQKEQSLFGARDFSGTRSVYYNFQDGAFSFSTTIKPLLNLPYIRAKINEKWLSEYLAIFGMIETIEANSTIYEGIFQLPPSHSIIVSKGKLTVKQYTSNVFCSSKGLKSDSEYEEGLRDVFQKAVNSRVRTHRGIGSHLSGGLDSSSVLGFAARALSESGKDIHTYSYVPIKNYRDWTPRNRIGDESSFIAKTVNYISGVEANYLSFQESNSYNEIDNFLDIYEMPYKFFENSYWVRGIYEKAQTDGVGVLLKGARGNWTVSWGPALDYYALLVNRLRLKKLVNEVNLYSENIGIGRKQLYKIIMKKAWPKVHNALRPDQTSPPTLINEEFADRSKVFQRIDDSPINLNGTKTQSFYQARKDHFHYPIIWNTTGTIGTKLSLKYKLQDRDPTNDLRVVQYCNSLPEKQCVRDGVDRSLIRRITKGVIPDEVRLNQKVRGIQGSDGIARMASEWGNFNLELEQLVNDPISNEYLNVGLMKSIMTKNKEVPKPSYFFYGEFKILMRGIISYRFLKQLEGR
ncbi:asparagine synthetase B [Alteribacter lacisalsi]|uniref:asparagine synthase (glutamine-hydrolyzing) n=1 Tax=Alteribacter lacisalsi TaxID=2045244 RepID=A0A2W0H557_9BACI|nr:asparagine synthase-related protein [Alteribacter lacisalsi]PYZ96964.1 asparagine synthetase B [Alteribacter lacisalsi]